MNLQDIVYPIGQFVESMFELTLIRAGEMPDIINFNYLCIYLGFFGLFVWLRMQNKFNAAAKANPNQLK